MRCNFAGARHETQRSWIWFCLFLLYVGSRFAAAAESISLVPNPFSPFVIASAEGNTEPGLAVRLLPDSDSLAFVRLHVFALDGTPVRDLSAGMWIDPAGTSVYWDGKDNDGHWVRNGRYVLVVQRSYNAADRPRRVSRHSVVLFK